jgi:hypothetical protein
MATLPITGLPAEFCGSRLAGDGLGRAAQPFPGSSSPGTNGPAISSRFEAQSGAAQPWAGRGNAERWFGDTDRENQSQVRSSGERHQTAAPSLVSSHPDAQNCILLCLVPPKSHAGMGLVPRFDRARNPHAGLITSVIGCLT